MNLERVAAIDCGTNSLRLLVADLDEHGGKTDIVRRMEVVRLGAGVDVIRRLDPDAVARTLAVSERYAATCRELGVDRMRFVATSAARDAAGSAEFFAGVRAIFGVDADVVSGTQEAELAFAGVASGLAGRFPAPYLVVDLGGGSTELVLGAQRVEATWSMDVGCVRMTERHLASDPPTATQIDACRADVRAALADAVRHVPLGQTATLVGVAGSITTVTAHALGLAAYDPARIDGAVLPLDTVLASCDALLAMTRAQRAELGFMHPGRVDVMGGGAIVWHEVIEAVRDAVAAHGGVLETQVTSEHDILDGIALSLARR